MTDFLPLIVVFALLLGGLWVISKKQIRDYRNYLERHTEETQRQTETQRDLVERQVAAIDRQTEVLRQIAKSLETRSGG